MEWQKIASLKTLTDASSKSCCAVLFHGYGASAKDLAPLKKHLDPKNLLDWYFPEGFLNVDIGMGLHGKAWFPIDQYAFKKLERDHVLTRDLEYRPSGADKALEKTLGFIEKLQSLYDQVIFGGFSQGAILSVDMCWRLKIPPEKLIVLSGALMDSLSWKKGLEKSEPLNIFQSHGNQDMTLPYPLGQKLYDLFRESGHKCQFHSFSGGHEIPSSVIEKLNQFIFEN